MGEIKVGSKVRGLHDPEDQAGGVVVRLGPKASHISYVAWPQTSKVVSWPIEDLVLVEEEEPKMAKMQREIRVGDKVRYNGGEEQYTVRNLQDYGNIAVIEDAQGFITMCVVTDGLELIEEAAPPTFKEDEKVLFEGEPAVIKHLFCSWDDRQRALLKNFHGALFNVEVTELEKWEEPGEELKGLRDLAKWEEEHFSSDNIAKDLVRTLHSLPASYFDSWATKPNPFTVHDDPGPPVAPAPTPLYATPQPITDFCFTQGYIDHYYEDAECRATGGARAEQERILFSKVKRTFRSFPVCSEHQVPVHLTTTERGAGKALTVFAAFVCPQCKKEVEK